MIKRVGEHVCVSVNDDGWPHWTRITSPLNSPGLCLSHEEARDLYYAMGRVVAFLDEKEAESRARLVPSNRS